MPEIDLRIYERLRKIKELKINNIFHLILQINSILMEINFRA